MAAQIQYPYAFDEDNNLVFIDDVVKENRYDHTYHCPNCGGEMLPRLVQTGQERLLPERHLQSPERRNLPIL